MTADRILVKPLTACGGDRGSSRFQSASPTSILLNEDRRVPVQSRADVLLAELDFRTNAQSA